LGPCHRGPRRTGAVDTAKTPTCAGNPNIGTLLPKYIPIIYKEDQAGYLAGIVAGFLPTRELVLNRDMLYIAIGILGATVMPHNLYLHSSIVQTRKYLDTTESKREATHSLGPR